MKALEDFCDKHIKSFVCWDLVIFFFDNKEGLEGDADALAAAIGRNPEEVTRHIEDLVESGLLVRSGDRYVLTEDVEQRHSVEEFVRAVDDRSQRLALLTLLLKKGIR